MNEEELRTRLAAIEQRLDAQLIWQAAVMPALLALLTLPADARALQLDMVALIEQADQLAPWSVLTPAERERAREYAEALRELSAGGTSQAQPETGRPG